MKKGMCITYEVEDGLYVNVTNRCSNNCSFCIRNNADGAYGSDSLWLISEPSLKQIEDAVFSRELTKYREIVFCGYGEPTYRIGDVRTVALKIKEKYKDIPIRINTNGQSDLINGFDTSYLFEGAFDTVSISLNAPNAEKYAEICRPVYKNQAFSAILKFAKNVKKYVQNTRFSVVGEFLTQKEVLECDKISTKLGIAFRIRDYISAGSDE